MTLADLAQDRNNNLNLVRMIAALGVLVSHAYPIALGPGTADPLAAAIGVSLGTLSVYAFFAISGFLVTGSLVASPTVSRWVAGRALRILPGLVVALALCAFALGPLATSLPLAEYLGRLDTWTYVPRNAALVSLQYPLPGVFETTAYGSPVNGSLWTLFHEAACYAAILMAGTIGLLRSRPAFTAALIGLFALQMALYLGVGSGLPARVTLFVDLAMAFGTGAAIFLWRDRIRLRWSTGAVAVAVAAALWTTPLGQAALVAALTYAVFLVAYLPGGALRLYNRLGDYSYGTYIYAFPCQQLAMHVAPTLSPWQNVAMSIPPTLALAILSWHMVERPALALRGRAAAPPAPLFAEDQTRPEPVPERMAA
jgi:peptidoglycan/LPS O-acetylase OafA/YrhL